MRNFISFLMIVLISFGLMMNDVHAKRFGGGRSFGMQRSMSAPTSRFQYAKNPITERSTARKWLGPLAGLLAGGLLASLFLHNGLGSGMMAWLIIGIIVLLLLRFIRARSPAPQTMAYHQAANDHYHDNTNTTSTHSSFPHTNMQDDTQKNIIEGFDANVFLRDAKARFIRLQTAYDQKNLTDIRKFTTPEVFAEIQLQLEEYNENKQTEVNELNAELLDTNVEFQTSIASVRFSGKIREDSDAPLQFFTEIWHFQKTREDSQWLISGIQQD